jgi:hypothetical protein
MLLREILGKPPMPTDPNAESIRAFWDAWTPGEELPLFIFDPEVAYEDTTLPDHIGDVYRGYDGLARAAERWLEPYESLTIELERIVGTGDRLVSIHQAWTFRNGKVVHLCSYRDPAEALSQLQG